MLQVKKAGAIDASAVESEAEMENIRRIRKPTVIAVIVTGFLSCIAWPLLTLPAGDFRSGKSRHSCAYSSPVPLLRYCCSDIMQKDENLLVIV